MIRSPELDALHRPVSAPRATRRLGLVGEDYRPHITLGMTAEPPSAPPFPEIPAGVVEVTMASGPVGPFGRFLISARRRRGGRGQGRSLRVGRR